MKDNNTEENSLQPQGDVLPVSKSFLENLKGEREYLARRLSITDEKIELLEGNKFLREFADKLMA